MIKFLQFYLGIPIAAIIVGTFIFVLPKIIHDNIKFYKETGKQVSHAFARKDSK